MESQHLCQVLEHALYGDVRDAVRRLTIPWPLKTRISHEVSSVPFVKLKLHAEIIRVWFLMRRSALKVRSTSKVVQGNAKYMRSKHVKLGNKLAEFWFSANSIKIASEWDCLNHCLSKIYAICRGTVPCLHRVWKSHIKWRWCFSVQCNLQLIQAALRFLSLPSSICSKSFHYISDKCLCSC